MTKGIVTCNLYKRKGSPSVNAPKLGYFTSGDEIKIEDVVLGETENDYYEGVATWYKLPGEVYVWSGGVSVDLDKYVLQKKFRLDNDSQDVNDSEEISVLKKIIAKRDLTQFGRGAEIRIAILDTGIDTGHPALLRAVDQTYLKYHSSAPNIKYQHGTLVAGLLVGNDSVITGTSIEANLIDIRVANNIGSVKDDAVHKVLKDISEGKIDCSLINMSLDVSFAMVPYLQTIIDVLSQRNIVVILAGTTPVGQTAISELDGVIKVGAYSYEDLKTTVKHGDQLANTVSFLNKPIRTTSFYPDHDNFKDSSAYTAVITGLVANYLSSFDYSDQNAFQLVEEFIKSISFPISKETTIQSFKPYRS